MELHAPPGPAQRVMVALALERDVAESGVHPMATQNDVHCEAFASTKVQRRSIRENEKVALFIHAKSGNTCPKTTL